MVKSKRDHKYKDLGFTLMEITFAIVILAGSLVILLGLQSSVIQRTVNDTQKLKAITIARQILAAIEYQGDELQEQDSAKSAVALLEELIPADTVNVNSEEEFRGFTARLIVEPWGIPQIDPDAMRRIQLTIYWGEELNEALPLVFFVPASKQGSQQGDVDQDML